MESLGLLCLGVRVLATATLSPRPAQHLGDVLIQATGEQEVVEGRRGRLQGQGNAVFWPCVAARVKVRSSPGSGEGWRRLHHTPLIVHVIPDPRRRRQVMAVWEAAKVTSSLG
ncbi:hypothetical protein E2C01_031044 [Portunus trituberculatus]|uniref:Secreted protein n=1 Tax=Portunus trituberculatus TaxID=210409 RepID=A0A5B7EX17_PORTR|nr:hypothetical protein [Portunus trituberculatus]